MIAIKVSHSTPPRSRISALFDPCFALDEFGLWATVRLQGPNLQELDVFLPAGRSYRRLEVGHDDPAGQLGQFFRQRLLATLDKTLASPLKLVLDPRRSDGSETILDDRLRPRESSVKAIAAIVNATSYSVSGYAVEFSILKPQRDRLAIAASSIFGPQMGPVFGRTTPNAQPPIGFITGPQNSRVWRGSLRDRPKVATYIRTASPSPKGRNTVEAQQEAIEAYLGARALRSNHCFVDQGFSGNEVERSSLEALVELAKQGEIDVVVATSADRIFRSAIQFDRFLLQLRSLNVAVMLVDHSSNLTLQNQLIPRSLRCPPHDRRG